MADKWLKTFREGSSGKLPMNGSPGEDPLEKGYIEFNRLNVFDDPKSAIVIFDTLLRACKDLVDKNLAYDIVSALQYINKELGGPVEVEKIQALPNNQQAVLEAMANIVAVMAPLRTRLQAELNAEFVKREIEKVERYKRELGRVLEKSKMASPITLQDLVEILKNFVAESPEDEVCFVLKHDHLRVKPSDLNGVRIIELNCEGIKYMVYFAENPGRVKPHLQIHLFKEDDKDGAIEVSLKDIVKEPQPASVELGQPKKNSLSDPNDVRHIAKVVLVLLAAGLAAGGITKCLYSTSEKVRDDVNFVP